MIVPEQECKNKIVKVSPYTPAILKGSNFIWEVIYLKDLKKFLLVVSMAVVIVTNVFSATIVFADDYYDGFKVMKEEEIRPYVAASVLVMDAETGTILYHTDGFSRRYPASVTKVMTALLVMEHVEDLDERVVFSAHAVNIPFYASRMGIQVGECLSVREALYGIMLPSGNEVARALAEHVSGSVPAFVELMNRRAVELGAYNTRFVNACGLPGNGQFITAYDLALIMREAIQHPVFLEIIATAYFEIEPLDEEEEPWVIRNTNRMVRPADDAFNAYVIGGKTGFTNAAQHTLVSFAERSGYSIIISVLFAPQGATFTDTAFLMDYVFSSLLGIPFEFESTIPLAPVISLRPPRPPLVSPYATEEELEAARAAIAEYFGTIGAIYYEADSDDEGEPIEDASNENSETVPVFSPSRELPVPSLPNNSEVTDTEALTVASMSLGVVAVALGSIYLLQKQVTKKK